MNAMELKIPPPLVWLVCAAAAWLSTHYLPARALEMAALRWLVWPLLLCGVLLALPALALFVRARTTMHPRAPERSSRLVTGGVYRFSRNPMYLALALLLLAWVLWLGNGVGLVWPALFGLSHPLSDCARRAGAGGEIRAGICAILPAGAALVLKYKQAV